MQHWLDLVADRQLTLGSFRIQIGESRRHDVRRGRRAKSIHYENFAQGLLRWPRHQLPFAAAVKHFTDALAHVPGPLGIGLQPTWGLWMFKGFLDAEENGFGREES